MTEKKAKRKIPVMVAQYLTDEDTVRIKTEDGEEIDIDQETFEKVSGFQFITQVEFQLIPLKKGDRKTKNTIEVEYNGRQFTFPGLKGAVGELCAQGFLDGTGIVIPPDAKEKVDLAREEDKIEPYTFLANVVIKK